MIDNRAGTSLTTPVTISVSLTVNGTRHALVLDPRTTLLAASVCNGIATTADAIRDELLRLAPRPPNALACASSTFFSSSTASSISILGGAGDLGDGTIRKLRPLTHDIFDHHHRPVENVITWRRPLASRRQARHIHNPDRVRDGQRHDLQQFVDAAAHFERILGNLRSKHRNVVIIEIAAESGRWAALLSNSDKSGIQVQPDCERC
jgi:hypothetical protein